ncbi:hypothetical protein XENTR_v10010968 [Xenopus tropicalis]|nr:hypothetical protein XENTR_v10010968 [Xenopus tropicalis]
MLPQLGRSWSGVPGHPAQLHIAEMAIIWLSMRGGILYTEPRDSMQYVLYVRLAILVIEFIYAIMGIVWLAQYYTSCNDVTAKNVTLELNLS